MRLILLACRRPAWCGDRVSKQNSARMLTRSSPTILRSGEGCSALHRATVSAMSSGHCRGEMHAKTGDNTVSNNKPNSKQQKNKSQTANIKQQTSNTQHKQQITNNKQQKTNKKQQTTKNKYGLRNKQKRSRNNATSNRATNSKTTNYKQQTNKQQTTKQQTTKKKQQTRHTTNKTNNKSSLRCSLYIVVRNQKPEQQLGPLRRGSTQTMQATANHI